MIAPNTYNPFENSVNNAKTVVSLEWLYQEVRTHLSKLIVVTLVIITSLPIVFLFGFWLHMQRKRFQKCMKKEPIFFKSNKDYLEFKVSLEKLDVLMPSLQKVLHYDLNKTPWPMKYTLRQMQKMTSTLVTFNSWLKTRLSPFNETKFKSKSQAFHLISEGELWKNRNPVYQYWM